ncbi:DUF4435 domain-containing protein [Pseudomonas lijiangensis]|uniref:DUF4435 domain-containing protein n=1 Tax=Pseudomonas lijiangensis TaxID=2995658 RepID=UPI0034D6317A
MELKYSIPKYVAMTRMSSKIRVLVEGKDDRGHISNLLQHIYPRIKLRVDSAIEITGDCHVTKNNNRAKIEKIHGQCKSSLYHQRLFFLCDREFRNFEIGATVIDKLDDHESDGNLSWTLGHSIENYFLSPVMLGDGFRFLSASGFKTQAITFFCQILGDALRKISALTLAAKELGRATYPASQITWQNIVFTDNTIEITKTEKQIPFQQHFWNTYESFLGTVALTDENICTKLCRGHTAMIVLQRVFAACLYKVSAHIDENIARYDANLFSNVGEINISSALSEAWIRQVKEGKAHYPLPLVNSISAISA